MPSQQPAYLHQRSPAAALASSELAARGDAAAALVCNLCGAMVGGLLENLSMVIGLKAILLLAFVAYLASMLAALKRSEREALSQA